MELGSWLVSDLIKIDGMNVKQEII